MRKSKNLRRLLPIGILAFSLSAVAWQDPGSASDRARQDQATQDQNPANANAPTFSTQVVSRTLQAIDFRHGGSTTELKLKGTDLMPEAKGEAKVQTRTGRLDVDASLEHLRPANSLGLEYLTYVLWAVTPEGRATNLGEMVDKDGKASLEVTSNLQAFGLMVTAEPYFAVSEPSDMVIAENQIPANPNGRVEPINVHYNLLSRGVYRSQVQPIQSTVYGIDKHVPLGLMEARNAVRIAKDANAEQYAASTFTKAQDLLNQAEDYYRRKQGSKPIDTVAREAAQTAEEARVMTIKREQEARVEKQRQEQEQRAAAAQAEAQAQAQQAAQAQAQQAQEAQRAAEARQQAEAAAQQAQQAQQNLTAAQQAQQQAQQAAQEAQREKQEADQARAQAEQARQQAENEKSQMRERLMQQLNSVLQTRDTARGLIATMPDVLFNTGSAELKPAARERLAKVAGILLAYPEIHLEVDGYTDNTGTAAFNEKLSQQRAEAVRTFLAQQGVANASMETRGFGEDQPIASNDTPQGRQQNRRVELVVSGNVIGNTTSPNQQATASPR